MKPRLLVALAVALVLFLAAYLFSRPAGGPDRRGETTAETKRPGEGDSEPSPRRSLIPPSGQAPSEAETTAAAEPAKAPDPSSDDPTRPERFDYAKPATNGLFTRSLTAADKEKYKIPEKLTGVVVSDVDPRSGAAEAALLPGDVIVRANFTWIDERDNTLDKLVGDRSFTALTVYRNGVPFDVVLHKAFDPTKSSSRAAP